MSSTGNLLPFTLVIFPPPQAITQILLTPTPKPFSPLTQNDILSCFSSSLSDCFWQALTAAFPPLSYIWMLF